MLADKVIENSIYHIESQCEDYNNIPIDIIDSEAKKIKKILKNYSYPKNRIKEHIDSFYNYFN